MVVFLVVVVVVIMLLFLVVGHGHGPHGHCHGFSCGRGLWTVVHTPHSTVAETPFQTIPNLVLPQLKTGNQGPNT